MPLVKAKDKKLRTVGLLQGEGEGKNTRSLTE